MLVYWSVFSMGVRGGWSSPSVLQMSRHHLGSDYNQTDGQNTAVWSFGYCVKFQQKAANIIYMVESILVAWYSYNRTPQLRKSHINIVLVPKKKAKCDPHVIRINSNFVDFLTWVKRHVPRWSETSRISGGIPIGPSCWRQVEWK